MMWGAKFGIRWSSFWSGWIGMDMVIDLIKKQYIISCIDLFLLIFHIWLIIFYIQKISHLEN